MDEKKLYKSKTMIGLGVTAAGIVMGQMGLDATPLVGSEHVIVEMLGLALSFYGRIKAVKRVRL